LRIKELPDLPDIRLGSNGTPSTIDLGPLPPRNQVTMEVEISPDTEVGPVSFRLQTPLGTSPMGTLVVEPYYGETLDKEPNDTLDNAFEVFLPAILTGAISRPGDIDTYKIGVKAGQELTSRQREILQLVAEGRSMKEIGALLEITPRTVAHHKYRLMDQLHVKSTAELVQYAVKHNMV
jgi:DNA-binding CsgD family transcriptional regulator